MRDLILIVLVVGCSIVALRQPVFGLLTFVALGFLNPHTMTWSMGRNFPVAQFTGIATIVGYIFWSEPKSFPRQREALLLLGLWGAFGVSTVFAIFPDVAFKRFVDVSKILVMVFLSMSLINSERRLHLLLRVMALSLGFYGLKGGLFTIATGGKFDVYGPEGTFLAANNSIGMALTMNIPILVYLLKVETKSWLRRILMAMVVLSFPAIIATYSRGAWVGLAIVAGLLVWRSRRRVLIITIIGLLAMASLPMVAIVAENIPQRVTERYDVLKNYKEDASALSRFWNWEFCKRVGLAHPLTGGGFDFYSPKAYATYFPEFLERWPGKVWSCHSMWYTLFGEHGIPGLALWLSLIASCFISLRRIRLLGYADARQTHLIHRADMLQGSLVAYMVVGTFLDIAYFDMFYYLVAVLIIVKERIGRESTTDELATEAFDLGHWSAGKLRTLKQ